MYKVKSSTNETELKMNTSQVFSMFPNISREIFGLEEVVNVTYVTEKSETSICKEGM